MTGEPKVRLAIGIVLVLAVATAALVWWQRGERRQPSDPAVDANAERAHSIEVLLAERGADAAADRLTDELRMFGDDPRYVGAVARVMVDALYRSTDDPHAVATLVPVLERLLERAAANPDAASAAELECLALLRVGQTRYVEAVTLAEKAIRKEPASARPHVVLARVYLGRGESEAGLREVAKALQVQPDDPAALLLEGRILCTNSDVAEKGVERMLAAFAAAPHLPGVREEIEEGLFIATSALLGRDRHELAGHLLDRAAAAVGRRPGLVHALGRVAMKGRDFEGASALFEEAFAVAPARPELARDLADSLSKAGYAKLLAKDREGAVARFERAVAVAPPDFDTGGMKAVIESHDPKVEQDITAAKRAFDRATQLYAAGDKEGAKKALLESIAVLPLNPLAHLNLGRIELELGHAKEASSNLETAIAIGRARSIDVEEAYPFLVRALVEQEAGDAKVSAVIAEYRSRYPKGRYRDALARPASGG